MFTQEVTEQGWATNLGWMQMNAACMCGEETTWKHSFGCVWKGGIKIKKYSLVFHLYSLFYSFTNAVNQHFGFRSGVDGALTPGWSVLSTTTWTRMGKHYWNKITAVKRKYISDQKNTLNHSADYGFSDPWWTDKPKMTLLAQLFLNFFLILRNVYRRGDSLPGYWMSHKVKLSVWV